MSDFNYADKTSAMVDGWVDKWEEPCPHARIIEFAMAVDPKVVMQPTINYGDVFVEFEFTDGSMITYGFE